jgi:hypothetical protein
MFRTLNDVIAPNRMDKLPMLPDVHGLDAMFGMHKPGHKAFKRRSTKGVVKRKTGKKVARKVVKRKTVPKSLKNKAKKLGIKLTVKRGDKRVAKTEKVLRMQVEKKKKMVKSKKAKSVAKGKAVKKKRKMKSKASPRSSFGTYWDNTQLLYAPSAASQQPAGTAGGNSYPYEGDMTPYFTVGNKSTVPFPMFGKRRGRKSRFGAVSAPMNRGMWNTQTPLGQGVSRNYCKQGTQCGSFPRSVEQAYPFTTDTRMKMSYF